MEQLQLKFNAHVSRHKIEVCEASTLNCIASSAGRATKHGCSPPDFIFPIKTLFRRTPNLFRRDPNHGCGIATLFSRILSLDLRNRTLFRCKPTFECRIRSLFPLKPDFLFRDPKLFCRIRTLFCRKRTLFCPERALVCGKTRCDCRKTTFGRGESSLGYAIPVLAAAIQPSAAAMQGSGSIVGGIVTQFEVTVSSRNTWSVANQLWGALRPQSLNGNDSQAPRCPTIPAVERGAGGYAFMRDPLSLPAPRSTRTARQRTNACLGPQGQGY
jgi:hypothetical protein